MPTDTVATMNNTNATERVLQLANDDGHEPNDPGVYALEVDLPDTEADVKEQWRDEYEQLPPYLHRLVDCDRAIYVGATADVQGRIADHLASDKRTASLPTVFGFHWIREVRFYDNKEDAFQVEYNAAREIDRETPPTTYVHSR